MGRGCSGIDTNGDGYGERRTVDFRNTCRWNGSATVDCTSCVTGDGPSKGCYLPTEMADSVCTEASTGYWTSTARDSFYGYFYSPASVFTFDIGNGSTLLVRCVTPR